MTELWEVLVMGLLIVGPLLGLMLIMRGKPPKVPRPTEAVRVKIPADLSYTGEERWKDAEIDAEIADIVKALQQGGIDMRASCSGHGKRPGEILLQDGRRLIVVEEEA
jgi:hypothetical protein